MLTKLLVLNRARDPLQASKEVVEAYCRVAMAADATDSTQDVLFVSAMQKAGVGGGGGFWVGV
jgi:hypothetical protein